MGRDTIRMEGRRAACLGDMADYVKFVTERVANRLDQPQESPEVRRERRRKREPWMLRWFGHLLPVGIVIWWNGRRLAARRTDPPDNGLWTHGHPE